VSRLGFFRPMVVASYSITFFLLFAGQYFYFTLGGLVGARQEPELSPTHCPEFWISPPLINSFPFRRRRALNTLFAPPSRIWVVLPAVWKESALFPSLLSSLMVFSNAAFKIPLGTAGCRRSSPGGPPSPGLTRFAI